MQNRQSNPFAAITIIILIVIIFIGYWLIIPVYGQISTIFHDNSGLVIYTTEEECTGNGNYWITDSGAPHCAKIPSRAKTIIAQQRKAWLMAPFIFVISLIIWYFTKSSSRDPQQWRQ